MYEAQAWSPLSGKWGILKLARTKEECKVYIKTRVNPAWTTRVVPAFTGRYGNG